MNGVRQGWLVARREMRERSRSRAFLISLALMAVIVAAMLVVPALLSSGGGTRNIGLAGSVPPALAATIAGQADAAGITARVHHYASLAAGEQAVRQGRADVLVAGERAAAAGISPGAAASLLAPVPVTSVELGHVAGRSPADETAVTVMTLVLFFCISIFGSMVLTGVLEEKASRVVEVLLARIPARALLAGKIAGIGLLGLAQIGVTALAALVAVAAVPSIHLPAVRGAVLAWAVVWFVLGYALYATVYGALGSLGSRVEDAQSVAGPVMVILPVAYFASFVMIAQPASAAARAISYFPLTAPMAMPGRIAMGAAAWWEPVAAAIFTLATTAALVLLAGRLYTSAILHTGPRLSLKDAWHTTTGPGPGATGAGAHATQTWPRTARAATGGRTTMTRTDLTSHRLLITILTGAGIALGIAIAVLTSDVILGVIAGVGFIAAALQMVRLWTGHPGPPAVHN